MPTKATKNLLVSTSICMLLVGSGLIQAAPAVPVIDRAERNTSNNTASGPIVPAQGARVSSGPLVPAQQGGGFEMQRGELLMLVEQLQEEVRYLRGKVEEQAHQMKQMETDQRDRYRDLDRRISNISRQLSEGSAAPTALPSSSGRAPAALSAPGQNEPSAAGTDTSDSDASVPTPRTSDTEAYKSAFAKVRERQYAEALAAFEEFRKWYPDSPLLPNTLYWSGEVYRAKSKPEPAKAKDAFQELIERFPSHQKAADAYYKLGLSYADLGDDAKAKEIMRKVVELYEGQVPAQLAKDYLNR